MHTHALTKTLSGWDICTQYLVPALVQAGWDLHRQMREQVTFTRGRIIVRGKLHSRGQARRADFILYRQPNFELCACPILFRRIIEAGNQFGANQYDAI